jgi:hypothetical protein
MINDDRLFEVTVFLDSTISKAIERNGILNAPEGLTDIEWLIGTMRALGAVQIEVATRLAAKMNVLALASQDRAKEAAE